MDTLARLNGRIFSALVRVFSFCQKWWLKYVLLPLVFLAIPLLLIGALKGEGPLPSVPFLVKLEPGDQRTIFIFCALIIYAYKVIPEAVRGAITNGPNLTLERALLLIESLEKIVETKYLRFNGELAELERRRTRATGAEIFNRITRPEQQIAFVLQVLHAFIQELDQSVVFKVRLIRVCEDSGRALDWFYYVPPDDHPYAPAARLNEQETLFSACARRNGLVVVEDIAKELREPSRNFLKFESGMGSALCYPMRRSGQKHPGFVLAISANKPGFFQNKQKRLYNWVLSKFAQRIRLEYTLLRLKEEQPDEKPASA